MNRILVSDIQRHAAMRFNCPPERMHGRGLRGQNNFPRHAAMYLARRLTRQSLKAIAGRFGLFDHSSVIHAIRRAEMAMAEDPKLAATVAELERELAA